MQEEVAAGTTDALCQQPLGVMLKTKKGWEPRSMTHSTPTTRRSLTLFHEQVDVRRSHSADLLLGFLAGLTTRRLFCQICLRNRIIPPQRSDIRAPVKCPYLLRLRLRHPPVDDGSNILFKGEIFFAGMGPNIGHLREKSVYSSCS